MPDSVECFRDVYSEWQLMILATWWLSGFSARFLLRDVGSIPAHSTMGSEGFISGDRISILGVVRIPHKAVGPVAAPTDW